uniref:Arsenite methyltransferase n=1 Tax=Gouania willdenowi TaxID=441366 RepID=A0A8C5GH92_GOUWI
MRDKYLFTFDQLSATHFFGPNPPVQIAALNLYFLLLLFLNNFKLLSITYSKQISVMHFDLQYNSILKSSSDLRPTSVWTPSQPVPAFIRHRVLPSHRYYGCGLVVPDGSGRDCYMLSQLVGEKGHVTGIDMTEDQLEVARRFVDYHMKEFGYKKPNVDYVQGYIEALTEAGLQNNSFDIIISNCVVNLSPDKRRVLAEAYSVLKDGGEFYFSDVYSSGRLTEEIKNHKVLWGECIGGALWWKDLLQLAEEAGFSLPRLVTAQIITVDNKELQDILGDYKFVSATYRLFKVPKVNPTHTCQVIYNGHIKGANEVVTVDAEMASILTHSRYAESFHVSTSRWVPVSHVVSNLRSVLHDIYFCLLFID